MTDDPLFVMLKPTVIYVIVGVVMLKRGWMNRYLPPIAQATVPDLAITFGYVWAGLMFFSAALNIVLALSARRHDLGRREVGLGDRQQGRPVRHPVRDHEVDRHPPGACHDGGWSNDRTPRRPDTMDGARSSERGRLSALRREHRQSCAT